MKPSPRKKSKRVKSGRPNTRSRSLILSEEEMKLQIENNKIAREDKTTAGRDVYTNVVKRTTIKRIGPKDVPKEVYDNINSHVALLKDTDKPKEIFFWKVELLEGAKPSIGEPDELFRRGGFNEEEGKAINKSKLCRNDKKGTLGAADDNNRNIPREKTEEVVMVVLLDGLGDPAAIILQNILDEAMIQDRNELFDLKRKNWSYGCSASGPPCLARIYQQLRTSLAHQESFYGIKNASNNQVIQVSVSKNGSGESATATYFNPKKDVMSFQAGNLLPRTVHKSSKKLGQMIHTAVCWDWLCILGPLVYDPKGMLKPQNINQVALAVNEQKDGNQGQFHWHLDKIRNSASFISARSQMGCELNSQEKCGANAGQYALEFGGALLPCGHKDILIVSGSDYHGPVAVAPSQRQKEKNKKKRGKDKRRATRNSIVLFHK